MHGSSGCFGCYKKSTLITLESKEFSKQGQGARKPSTSDNFWTTSTHDMDNSAVQSQGSISSTSVTNQVPDPHGGSCKTSNPTEFVNHGLILWNQTRQQWVGNMKPQIQSQQLREPKLSTYCLCLGIWLCSWNATYESLLGSSKPFPQPIPLPEMVDFLVDIWDQEGLYD
ncbi:hypothetical protein QN277_024311 [Acacia crassicarpa]|uniref:Gag1-like clamp domain-containing protein n=1 Tax=Acacia crassicarpa TaxID=499986 RepID=A0AAE1JEY7_9FABA|nr:hypothetical protein QN277_024311 [Acacia crassicarpa]